MSCRYVKRDFDTYDTALYYHKVIKNKKPRYECPCGMKVRWFHKEQHKIQNINHIFYEQNCNNPEFVKEYNEIMKYGVEKKTLKSYYLKKLKKKYNFIENNSSNSSESSESSDSSESE